MTSKIVKISLEDIQKMRWVVEHLEETASSDGDVKNMILPHAKAVLKALEAE